MLKDLLEWGGQWVDGEFKPSIKSGKIQEIEGDGDENESHSDETENESEATDASTEESDDSEAGYGEYLGW